MEDAGHDLDPHDPRADVADHATVLDVREDGEWSAGHAPGAVHVPMSELPARLADLPEGDGGSLAVVCRPVAAPPRSSPGCPSRGTTWPTSPAACRPGPRGQADGQRARHAARRSECGRVRRGARRSTRPGSGTAGRGRAETEPRRRVNRGEPAEIGAVPAAVHRGDPVQVRAPYDSRRPPPALPRVRTPVGPGARPGPPPTPTRGSRRLCGHGGSSRPSGGRAPTVKLSASGPAATHHSGRPRARRPGRGAPRRRCRSPARSRRPAGRRQQQAVAVGALDHHVGERPEGGHPPRAEDDAGAAGGAEPGDRALEPVAVGASRSWQER